jgi:hypothetical protein
MTADYNGWNDAPEAEREAIDVYALQEFDREQLLLQPKRRTHAREMGYSDLRPAA